MPPRTALHLLARRLGPAAALICVAGPAAADGLRCGNQLIGAGDRMYEVREACGEPDVRVVLHSVYTLEYGPLPQREEWQYNFGPQELMRFLRFRNSRLTNVVTGPHGFSKPAENCDPARLTKGISQLELLARCGEPALIERRVAEHSYRLGPTGPYFPVGTPVEDWIYRFGANRFDRIVTVIDGQVIQIETNS